VRAATLSPCLLFLAASAVAQQPRPIIDMHLHAYDPVALDGEVTFCANRGPVGFPPIDPALRCVPPQDGAPS